MVLLTGFQAEVLIYTWTSIFENTMNMNTAELLTLTVLGLSVLTACGREDAAPAPGDRTIAIRAEIYGMTRVATTGNEAVFETGDRITLYAWTGSASVIPASRVVDGVDNTLGSDGKWTPAARMLWADMVTPHYFLGIYPARNVSDLAADSFMLNPADYEAGDLLVATNLSGLKAQGNPITLTFDHMMAKMVVNLKFRSQWDATPSVSGVTAYAKSAATVDYLTKGVTATGDAGAVSIPAASAPEGYALGFSGLQVPQKGVRKVTVTIAGKEYVYESAEDIPLASGKITTLGLIVGREALELAAVNIADWTAGASLEDGEATIAEP